MIAVPTHLTKTASLLFCFHTLASSYQPFPNLISLTLISLISETAFLFYFEVDLPSSFHSQVHCEGYSSPCSAEYSLSPIH